MRVGLICVATVVAVLTCSDLVQAQSLVYSFESPEINPDGFAPNGAGLALTQSTTGATEGASSLQATVVEGATFVGALTSVVPPAIGDPPGIDHILFDMTIDSGEEFTGGFAVVGVTIFGATQPDFPGGQQFGLPVQFADLEHIGGKVAGVYNDIRIDLDSATHPTTFAAAQTFNEIFGTVGSGPDDVIPTGFQFFLNKSNDAPLTVYIDNVRVVAIPEPASCVLLALGAVVLGSIVANRGNR